MSQMNNKLSIIRAIAGCVAMAASVALAAPAAADELWLAAGQSVTTFDGADLAPLLELKPSESVHSIATRVQVRSAGAINIGADGALALGQASAPAPAGGSMLEGGVFVREAGRWRLHATDPSPAAATPAAQLSSRERTLISKPGATRAQAERDIQQCRSYAERAAVQFLSSSARVAAYNNAMQSCLRSFGYTIHTPAA